MLKVVQIIPDDRDMFRNYEFSEPNFGSAPTALFEGFAELNKSVEVHVISCVRKRMPAPTKLAENIFYHQVLVPGGYRRTLFIQAVRQVRDKIRQINPDVVNGHGTEDYPALCAAYSGVPNCITIHGNMRAVARKLKYRPFPQMLITAGAEALALRKTDAVVCNSAYTEQCVGRLNRNKVRIPNAVRSSFFDLRPDDGAEVPTSDLRPPTSVPILLCIGEIVPYKNQVGLIHALDELAVRETFRLSFVGRCKAKSAYGRRFLREVSARGWCEYLEPMGEDALKKMLSSCCGLIHPTLEDSFGLVVAEAQVMGVPVAGSSVGGIPDLIHDGETGFLFDASRPGNVCEKVRLLLAPERRASVCANAQAVARTQYAPRRVAEMHLQLYAAIVGKRGAPESVAALNNQL
jgi:glycosyltransferase involved in cell wall biosynthesis